MLHRHRVIDLTCAGLEIALLLFLTPLAVLGKSYIAATIIAVVLGGTAFGHIKGRRWAARTTLYMFLSETPWPFSHSFHLLMKARVRSCLLVFVSPS